MSCTAAADDFAKESNVAAIFLKSGKLPYESGDRLRQPQLAASLRLISAQGPDAFYKGPIAAAIVAASKAHGGILSLEDFARYSVVERDPIRCAYRGYQIAAVPPPSSGGITICEILGILDGYKLADAGFHSAAAVHLMVEAMRHAFLDRNSRARRPGLRHQSGRAADLRGLRRQNPRRHRSPEGDAVERAHPRYPAP